MTRGTLVRGRGARGVGARAWLAMALIAILAAATAPRAHAQEDAPPQDVSSMADGDVPHAQGVGGHADAPTPAPHAEEERDATVHKAMSETEEHVGEAADALYAARGVGDVPMATATHVDAPAPPLDASVVDEGPHVHAEEVAGSGEHESEHAEADGDSASPPPPPPLPPVATTMAVPEVPHVAVATPVPVVVHTLFDDVQCVEEVFLTRCSPGEEPAVARVEVHEAPTCAARSTWVCQPNEAPRKPLTETIPALDRWASQVLERGNKIVEKEKEKEEKENTASAKKAPPAEPIPPCVEDVSTLEEEERVNMAGFDVGARIVDHNAEATGASKILNANRDSYLMTPCNVKKWVTISLPDLIQIEYIELANFELFSSTVKTFALLGSTKYPTKEWNVLGVYNANNVRTLQRFAVESSDANWVRYISLRFLSNHGEEFYCPISIVRVFGGTELQKFKQSIFEPLDIGRTHGDVIEQQREDIAEVPLVLAAEDALHSEDEEGEEGAESTEGPDAGEGAAGDGRDSDTAGDGGGDGDAAPQHTDHARSEGEGEGDARVGVSGGDVAPMVPAVGEDGVGGGDEEPPAGQDSAAAQDAADGEAVAAEPHRDTAVEPPLPTATTITTTTTTGDGDDTGDDMGDDGGEEGDRDGVEEDVRGAEAEAVDGNAGAQERGEGDGAAPDHSGNHAARAVDGAPSDGDGHAESHDHLHSGEGDHRGDDRDGDDDDNDDDDHVDRGDGDDAREGDGVADGGDGRFGTGGDDGGSDDDDDAGSAFADREDDDKFEDDDDDVDDDTRRTAAKLPAPPATSVRVEGKGKGKGKGKGNAPAVPSPVSRSTNATNTTAPNSSSGSTRRNSTGEVRAGDATAAGPATAKRGNGTAATVARDASVVDNGSRSTPTPTAATPTHTPTPTPTPATPLKSLLHMDPLNDDDAKMSKKEMAEAAPPAVTAQDSIFAVLTHKIKQLEFNQSIIKHYVDDVNQLYVTAMEEMHDKLIDVERNHAQQATALGKLKKKMDAQAGRNETVATELATVAGGAPNRTEVNAMLAHAVDQRVHALLANATAHIHRLEFELHTMRHDHQVSLLLVLGVTALINAFLWMCVGRARVASSKARANTAAATKPATAAPLPALTVTSSSGGSSAAASPVSMGSPQTTYHTPMHTPASKLGTAAAGGVASPSSKRRRLSFNAPEAGGTTESQK